MNESPSDTAASRAMRGALLILVGVAITACSSGVTDDGDGALVDAGGDARPRDAATPQTDAEVEDAGVDDAAPGDSGRVDSGAGDAGACSGKADGTACGSATSSTCDAPDTCKAGVCVTNRAADGTACGSATSDACTQPDTCVAGACVANHVADGVACGDTTSDACTQPDTCVAGACVANHVADGVACGDTTSDACTQPDTCVAGACVANHVADGVACGDTTTSACTQPDTCAAGACVANHVADGTACGDTTTSACTQPDTCAAGACVPNHAAAGTACGAATTTECNAADTCDANGACQARLAANGTSCYDCAEGGGLCTSCASGACSSASQCTASGAQLDTPIVNNNGQDGNMFDVVATNTVVITGFEGNIANTPNATTQYYVHYKVGSHVGFENNAAAWTQLAGPLTISPNAPTTLTPILNNLSVTIPAGQTYAFYLSNTAAASNNNRYHNGTATGTTLVSDANITIKEGTGGAYPFGTFFQARPWEGRVLYRGTAIATGVSGAVASDGVMFDVSATNALFIDNLGVHLGSGTHALEVYFRRGTHVGAETNPALWHLLDAQTGVAGSTGALTAVPFATNIRLDAGETASLYVTTGPGSAGVLSRAGTAVGTAVATNADATLREGVAVSGTFGAVGATSVAESRVGYAICVP